MKRKKPNKNYTVCMARLLKTNVTVEADTYQDAVMMAHDAHEELEKFNGSDATDYVNLDIGKAIPKYTCVFDGKEMVAVNGATYQITAMEDLPETSNDVENEFL